MSCRNQCSFHCPNVHCREVLLKAAVAYYIPDSVLSSSLLKSMPPLPDTCRASLAIDGEECTDRYWGVNDVFDFENMGFSKTIPTSKFLNNTLAPRDDHVQRPEQNDDMLAAGSCQPGERYMCCAVCDVGPLGASASIEGKWYYIVDKNRVSAKDDTM